MEDNKKHNSPKPAETPQLGVFGVVRCFNIQIHGCDDSTCFDMEMTEQEYQFLQKVCHLSTKTSTYGCMPTMVVEPK